MVSTAVQQAEEAVEDDRVRGGSMTRRRLSRSGEIAVRDVRLTGKHRRSRIAVFLGRAAAPVLAGFLASALVATGGASVTAATAIKDPVAPKAASAIIETYAPYLP